MKKHALVLLAAAPAAALILTACGSSSSTPAAGTPTPSHDMSMMPTPTSSGTMSTAHNAADIAFAQGMIPHHQQAVEMADLAASRASSPAVKALALRIAAAQTPEITMMTGWLTSWGEKVPDTMSSMSGMGDPMPGMMSDTDMTALKASSGTAFDTMFLTMMITHHQGALTQATTELANGTNPEAKALAQSIIDGQTKEITEMKAMLAAA